MTIEPAGVSAGSTAWRSCRSPTASTRRPHVHAVCPDHHFLEAWGDAEPVTGSFSLIQPTIAPLFETRAAQDSLLKWLGEAQDFHAYLRSYWQQNVFPLQTGRRDFEEFWDGVLQAGFLNAPVRVAAPASPALSWRPRVGLATIGLATRVGTADRFELHAYETVALRDGRHAKPVAAGGAGPIAKVTWGAASRSRRRWPSPRPSGWNVVTVTGGGSAWSAVWRQPGQPSTTGDRPRLRTDRPGPVGNGVGIALAFPEAQGGRTAGLQPSWRWRRPDGSRRSPRRRRTIRWKGAARSRSDARGLLADGGAGARLALPSLWAAHEPGSHTWA